MEFIDVDVNIFCNCRLLGTMCRVGIVDLVFHVGVRRHVSPLPRLQTIAVSD
jgi:hypothetical protein